MKRKFISMIFTALLCVCTLLGVSACTVLGKVPCLDHTYSEWKVTKAATCTESGEKTRICSNCKNVEMQTIAPLGHDYSEEWTSDENGHWHICVHENCSVKTETISHEDTNKDHKCDVCGDKLSDCADTNNDHKCDVCGDKLSDCVDTDKDHKCDICGNKLSDVSEINYSELTYIAWGG